MKVSFKISKNGTRFRPKPKHETHTVLEDDAMDASPENFKNLSVITATKPLVDVAGDMEDVSEISDVEISFFINLFPDGYSNGNPSENQIERQGTIQDYPKCLHPYDRTSESLFSAIERGMLPADFLDDIPCKFLNGTTICEVRDYRNCDSEPGLNASSANSSPTTTKIRLKMTLENVVKDISVISDSSWTYGDLMEAEARILKVLHPKLYLDPTPNLDRLCRSPTCTKLNLNIPELRLKRIRQLGAAAGSDNQVQEKKVCIERAPENSNSQLEDSVQMVQQPDAVNIIVGPSNMLASGVRTFPADTFVPESSSLPCQSKYQIGCGKPRVMQDHGSGTVFSAPGASPRHAMLNSYADNMNLNTSSTHGKRENQDGQLSPMGSLGKRGRSNSMVGLDGSQQHHMDGLNADSQRKKSLSQQQSVGRGTQLPNGAGIQKYPQHMFDQSFNQNGQAMSFTMGQPGMKDNLKQDPVESERPNKYKMPMVDSNVDPQQFTKANFPPAPWNNMGQSLDIARKEEQCKRRNSGQDPHVSAAGTLPQSPMASQLGGFSSGSMGGQYALRSSQLVKAVTSVPPGGGFLTTSANDSMGQHPAQMAVRRSNSLPKIPVPIIVAASPSNESEPSFDAPFIEKKPDKDFDDIFPKIVMLTARYKLNCKKNKVDEYKTTTAFPTQKLNHYLFNDQNNDIPKDEACKMPLSKSLVGGGMNVCKTRVMNFVQTERVHQGNGFTLVPKSRTRMILSQKVDDGTVAMHYGEVDDCDYLAEEEYLPTLPNTHVADLLATQFCKLIAREGYHVEGDHLQQKPINTVRSSGVQQNNASSISPNAKMQQIPEAVLSQPSNEVAKPSDSGTNNGSVNSSQNLPSSRMHPLSNAQKLQQISQGGLLMPQSRPLQSDLQPSYQQQQSQHPLMMQRSSAMKLASNPLSHMGQNSNMQQLGHMLNKATPLQLQILQQQQQLHMQRKMTMGSGNVGMGGSIGNNMVGLQGIGNVMGMGGALAGTGMPSMGQNSINMNQASNISNIFSHQLHTGMLTPTQAAFMNSKLRMAQNRNILGGTGGQSGNISGFPGANRQVHPGSINYSMLGPSMNHANNINPMQRTAMAPPKVMSNMNVYMNQQLQQLPQQQESASPLQDVRSPPQQVGSPSMGLPQQQTSSHQSPLSPQLSSGATHPPMSAGNQEGTYP